MGFEDIRKIEDMELIIDWDLRQQFAFVFEVPTEKILACIPEGLGIRPFEARPGMGLMFLGYNNYNPGNEIYNEKQQRFDEITVL